MSCPHTHKDAPENSVCEDCKLKTLKDIELPFGVDSICMDLAFKELRSEAVNWVNSSYLKDDLEEKINELKKAILTHSLSKFDMECLIDKKREMENIFENQLCLCGHTRKEHWGLRGLCKIDLSICSCSEFRLAKLNDMNLKEWIINFFNLTEEDLEEK